MDKQTVLCVPNGTLPCNKKEGTIDIFNNIDEFPNNYGEQEKPDKKRSAYCVSLFVQHPRQFKLLYCDKKQIGGFSGGQEDEETKEEEITKGTKKLLRVVEM